MKNKELAEKLLDKAHETGYLSGLDFSLFVHKTLISDGGYVIYVGNYENVNAEVAILLAEKIKKHPLIWKWLFMVA